MNNDEKIVEILNMHKKGTSGSIEEGYNIKENIYYFKKHDLFDKKVQVMLPEVFVDMPENLRNIKYPNINRPPIIKTNMQEGMDFTFNILPYAPEMKTSKITARYIKGILKKLNPAFQFFEEGNEVIDNSEVSWFDFKSFGIDSDMYNFYYYLDLKEAVLHGIFNCYLKDKENWKTVAKDVMRSICIL